ncbi:MAG: hypothetical protein C7B45_03420 [Sulfobacillus acidophilus]|uniref:Aspartyl-phosphate phosphatase Spo0E family protein n=1 Tax=Sulfobacillus acidophilus TaxID=53633 RepID=A0A2T2WMD0_9FIRM|nr:MAG: hypothetical protein C7B45_03420 [Sulfobacillus acidophilus]
MTAIASMAEYRQRIDQIKRLKNRLWILASQRGNLDPDVIQISQEIDEYIVLVQKFWQSYRRDETLTG